MTHAVEVRTTFTVKRPGGQTERRPIPDVSIEAAKRAIGGNQVTRSTTPQTRLRQINQQLVALTHERDQLIRGLRAEGFTLREIAQVAGLSHQTVANILNR